METNEEEVLIQVCRHCKATYVDYSHCQQSIGAAHIRKMLKALEEEVYP
jgi:hypothetical protein